jgi:hypothetical protein
MYKKWFFISMIMVLAVMLIAACAQTAPEPEAVDDVEALIIDKCSGCHSADKVFDANYDEAGWADVIDDMVIKGAEVTEEEKALMIEWLTGRN